MRTHSLSIAGIGTMLLLAAVFAGVAVALDVSPLPAVIGVLLAGTLELLVRTPAVTSTAVPAVRAPVPSWASAQVSTMPPPASPPTVPPAPAALRLPPAPEPAAETPCPSCGLYPAAAPAAVALPEPGTFRQLSPS